ncbi:MAG: hypothetical protein VR73_11935 [Gammaproteobacteria bacterium BRH_c0]|nr:MAG: hypothetical protein VR73_11935 [Gammaproteobacteria bacterium BRH_c0]
MVNLWNFIQFQVAWFAIVLSAEAEQPFLGVAVVALFSVVHLTLAENPLGEGLFLLLVGLLGWLWESLVLATGLIHYTATTGNELMAPVWIAALWLNFGSTLNYSLAWLQGRTALAAVFGAIGGPLAFYAGYKLGAVNFSNSALMLAIISVGWLVLTPLLVHASRAWRYYRVGTISGLTTTLPAEVQDD